MNNTPNNKPTTIAQITKIISDEMAKERETTLNGMKVLINENKREAQKLEQLHDEIMKLKNENEEVLDELNTANISLRDNLQAVVQEYSNISKEYAKNEVILQKIESERANAEKALSLMKMAADVEIEQFAAVEELNARERRIREELKEERLRKNDEYDLRKKAIQNGLSQYYPALSENLDRMIEEAEEEEKKELTAKRKTKKGTNSKSSKNSNDNDDDELPDWEDI